MIKFFSNITNKLAAWQTSHPDEYGLFYVSAVVIGILAGAAAALLKTGIGFVLHTVLSVSVVHTGNIVFLILPLCGILISVLYSLYIARQPMDHATERIADDLADNNGRLSPRLIIGPIISCSFTLGMGGSAGGESPIAYSGAAIGSNMGRAFGMDKDRVLALLGCGAAAGIAGIYMAPIGGVMFALEMLRMKQNLQTTLALTFSSLVAALTCYLLMGCHTDVTFMPEMRFEMRLIPYVLLCGVFCGLYSVYYIHANGWCKRLFGKIGNVWLKALTGGLMLAAMIFIFPSLYGEGYDTLHNLMNNESMTVVNYSPLYALGKHYPLLMLMFLALLAVKPIAVAATNSSGGVAGSFTPTFFCGGVAGYLFAGLLNYYFGLHLQPALFVFFGMAATMSGSKRAPLMAIFIAAEMTGLYGFILPLTLAASASFLTTLSGMWLVNRSYTRRSV